MSYERLIQKFKGGWRVSPSTLIKLLRKQQLYLLLPHSRPSFLLNRLPWRFTLRNLSVPCAAKKFRDPKWYPYLKNLN